MNRNVNCRKANAVLMLLAALCCGLGGGGDAPGAEAAADTIDVATYVGMCRLRKAIHLGNETLAAMGCSESDATGAMAALLVWRQANKTNIEANRKANIQAARELRVALRRIGMGPSNTTLLAKLPSMKAALAAAARQRNDLMKAAIAATEAQLSASQRSVWATVRKNIALPRKYRYAASLTAGQIKALHVANRTHARKKAAARDATAKTAVTQQFKNTEGNALSANQKTAMAAAQTNAAEKLAGVIKAANAVMPIPAALAETRPADLLDPMLIRAAADKAAEQ